MTPRPTFTLRRLNAALLMALAGTAGAQTLQEHLAAQVEIAQPQRHRPAAVIGVEPPPLP